MPNGPIIFDVLHFFGTTLPIKIEINVTDGGHFISATAAKRSRGDVFRRESVLSSDRLTVCLSKLAYLAH